MTSRSTGIEVVLESVGDKPGWSGGGGGDGSRY